MAGFFGLFDVTKEGPGVSKAGPHKRPVVVFFEIYGRKFWKIMQAGLLWVVLNLPLITRGLADAGLTYITRNFSRQKHAFVKEDFFDTIKRKRGQAFWCGVINQLITAVMLYNFLTYGLAMYPGLYALLGVDISAMQLPAFQPGFMDFIVIGCTLLGYTLFTWMKYYIPFLVVTFGLKTTQVYRNAFLFAVAGLKSNLLISAVLCLIYFVLVGAIFLIPSPLTIAVVAILWLLLVPGFRSLLIQFCIFPQIKRLMIDPYYKENPEADKQARRDLNLEVEEDVPTAEVKDKEPVFSDDTPAEQSSIPRQYTEQELRRIHRQRQDDNDDDTI